MIEEMLPGLYRIEVPLHGSPLKATNCYAIKGAERSLVIDTGWNREECREALGSGLSGCGIDLDQVDFFITHMHADHSGLVSTLAREGARAYFGQADARIIRFATPEHWQEQIDFAIERGFPREELEKAIGNHPGRRYSTGSPLYICVLGDGDTISVGDYLFECVETPGHTQGHLCLYEPGKKVLLCGDHILVDITPNITLSSRERNPLAEYLTSLDKVYDLDVELVLPGHRRIFRDHRERIRELKHHHRARLAEIASILENGKQDAFAVASQMTWDIDCQSWYLFPALQKLFAFAETVAHLKYLEEEGAVGWEMDGQAVVFFLTSGKKEVYT
ncbi:MAG: MBL fold metallo-hydrolase [Dehalococcoidia bacterium]|nr:MBL fold metallo-hydrolase [Dehalococcoidia bacterium]